MANLSFRVTRQPAVRVAPFLPTPNEFLYLSNLNDRVGLRFHIPTVQFYPCNSSKKHQDPAQVIKEALAKLLVHYYPFAGRLRDAPNCNLTVECTGEGVLFIEANADVSLQEFGDLFPPFSCWEELLYNVPGSATITNSPILLIQVTRLRCGRFIFALRLNHCMSDATGIVQFMKALEFDHVEDKYGSTVAVDQMSQKSFFFGPTEIAALKRQVGAQAKFSTFEVLSACLWRSRTRALNLPSEQEVKFIYPLDVRSKIEPPLPSGYYGNAFIRAFAKTRAGDLANKPLTFAVELIREAKAKVDNDYIRSAIDFMKLSESPRSIGSFGISNVTKIGFANVDFGWGKAMYGGPAWPAVEAVLGVPSFSFLLAAGMDSKE
eukprot:Gb_26887 [translate_table: standard]